jgi:hypothetical protein
MSDMNLNQNENDLDNRIEESEGLLSSIGIDNETTINKSLMIVHQGSGEEEPYAQHLFQLIAQTKKYGASQPITESEYAKSCLTINNIPNIPKGKIIFFGTGKEAKTQGNAIIWRYNHFGMKYGWLGNRCVISIEPVNDSLARQRAFVGFYNSRTEQFRQRFNFLGKSKFGKTGDLWKRQCELLICEFMENGLENFMKNTGQEESKGQLIAVFDPKDAEYAYLLNNLAQQYSGYDVLEFTEQTFIDNAKTLDASNKIVFLGDTKSSKARRLALVNEFDEYGMEYGWVKNHCFVNVKHLQRSEKEKFIEHLKSKKKEYSSIPSGGISFAGAIMEVDFPSVIKNIVDIVSDGVDWLTGEAEKIKNLQYKLVILEFVFNGLKAFMENEKETALDVVI